MKYIFIVIGFLITMSAYGTPNDKSRAIITTDLGGADPDDRQSMIHLLASSNLIDIEGIISSQAWVTDSDKTEHIMHIIDVYGEAYPNLIRHADGFPNPKYLKSVTMRGQSTAGMLGVGRGLDSPGSDLIIEMADKNDKRPIWILAWGGMNTLAQALQKVQQTRSSEELKSFLKKIRVYDVLGQDDAGAWIAKNYPEIFYIRNRDVYGWQPDDNWIKANIQSTTPLGTIYPDRIWAYEGDTPSFLHLLLNGINSPEDISYGGWGGRFDITKQKNIPAMEWVKLNNMDESQYCDYYMYGSSPEGTESIKKWSEYIWNDFATRMRWASTPDFSMANHTPLIKINGNSRLIPLKIKGKKGELIKLNASKTKDPDGNALTYLWQVYPEAGSNLNINELSDNYTSPKCEIRIPCDINDRELHIILMVKDNGTPALTACRRIVIEIQ